MLLRIQDLQAQLLVTERNRKRAMLLLKEIVERWEAFPWTYPRQRARITKEYEELSKEDKNNDRRTHSLDPTQELGRKRL